MRHRFLVLLAALLLASPAVAAPTIDVWYGDYQEFGQLGVPQQWVNVLGTVDDPVHGVASLTYTLNGGAPQSLSIGSDDRRLYFTGDFNVEIDFLALQDGLNSVVIEAQNGIGEITQRAVTVNFASTNIWPLPFLADWSSAASIFDVAQVTDGLWSIVAGPPAGIRPDEMAYDRAFVIGDLSWTNFEVTIPITIHATGPIGPLSGAPGIGITNRWQGHTTLVPGEQPHSFWLPQGAGLWYDFGDPAQPLFLSGSDGLFVDDPLSRTLALDTTYIWKLRAQSVSGGGSTFYAGKIWEEGTAEPDWEMSGFEGPPDILTGSLIVIAHHVDATFGNVDVVPLAPLPPPPSTGLFSDDFSGAALDGWVFRNPLDDSTSMVNGTQLEIAIPSTPEIHDIWIEANEAPRVGQMIGDGDFDVVAKFESVPSQDFQSQGLAVLQDDFSLVRAELHHNLGETYVFVATLLGPSAQIKTQTPIPVTNPMWLRVQRLGDLFNVYTSTDGTGYTLRSSFVEPLTVTEVALFAGSSAFTPFTAVVDSFEALSDPIVGEDADPSELVVNVIGRGSVSRSPDQSHYDVGEIVDLTAVADPGYSFVQWSGDATGSANPIAVSVTGGPTAVVAEFGPSTGGPPVISDIVAQPFAQAARITWTTNEPATSLVRYGITPYAMQKEDLTLTTEHNVFISGLSQLTDYHFKVESTDASMETTTSGDMMFRTKKKACGILGIEPFLVLGLLRIFRRRS